MNPFPVYSSSKCALRQNRACRVDSARAIWLIRIQKDKNISKLEAYLYYMTIKKSENPQKITKWRTTKEKNHLFKVQNWGNVDKKYRNRSLIEKN